jgi:hypothetical protein
MEATAQGTNELTVAARRELKEWITLSPGAKTMQWLRLVFLSMSAALLGCGGDKAVDTPVAAPTSSGTVLVMDGGTRTTAPAAVLGFVHGLHAIVLDGDRVFAGMSRIETTPGQDGAKTLTFPDGVTAQLVPAGAGFELRFSSGETIPLREQEAR